jgi:DNA-binding LacI/PurR family transcriptional regulator
MQAESRMKIALSAKCSTRTVERYLAGKNVMPIVEQAILDAARELKIKLPKRGGK